MKVYVRIHGLKPFVLKLSSEYLSEKHIVENIQSYYFESHTGNPPGLIFVHRVIHFKNGDKLFEFRRKEFPEITPLFDESMSCENGNRISTSSEGFNFNVPKVLSLNLLLTLMVNEHSSDEDSTRDEREDDILYDIEVSNKVQQRVISLILTWTTNFLFDFDDEMIKELRIFCEKDLRENNYEESSKEILHRMQSGCRMPYWESVKPINQILCTNVTNDALNECHDEIHWTRAKVRDIAESLTYIDYKLYKEIKFIEMLGQSWSKQNTKYKSPNLLSSIDFFNRTSRYISFTILKEQKPKRRAKMVSKLMKVIKELYEMKSFNMVMAIHSGVTSNPVSRLMESNKDLGERTIKTSQIMDALISNPRELKAQMKKCYEDGVPCSPYLGLYLKDLVYNDENDAFSNGKINFYKCAVTYNIITQALRYQKYEYKVIPNIDIVQQIQSFEAIDENSLYEMSYAIEPSVRKL